MENRSIVYSTSLPHAAQMVVDKLESEGIHALILNQQDSMYKAFGMIEVYVQNEELDKAKKIVEDFQE